MMAATLPSTDAAGAAVTFEGKHAPVQFDPLGPLEYFAIVREQPLCRSVASRQVGFSVRVAVCRTPGHWLE